MAEIQPDIQKDNSIKFYSQRAIAIATFIGGPLAAGILVRKNFINSGKSEYGKHALFIGIVSTILLFVGLFSLPEHIFEKIPNVLIPAVYTGIIYLIVERLQGQTLKTHKENSGQFYSVWKATGIESICMVFLLAGIFGYAYLAPEDFDTTKYDNGIAEFQKNEEKALTLFTLLETADTKQSVDFIQSTGIPIWKKNLQILDELDSIEGLYKQLKDQNEVLREYCQLRIDSYQLIGKAITEDTKAYDEEIEDIIIRIDELLKRLE